MATHSSIVAWEIPWTEEPGRLQPMESQRVGHLFFFFFRVGHLIFTQKTLFLYKINLGKVSDIKLNN